MTIFSLHITITCISKSNTPPQAAAIKHEAVIGEKTHEADKFKSESSEEPAGLLRKKPSFSFQVEESTGRHLKSARIRVSRTEDMTDLVYDSGERTDISSLSFTPEQEFEGGIRYYWDVCAEADNGDTGISSVAWFEGGCREEEWSADWIASPLDKEIQPVMYREFTLDAPVSEVACARLYITGLGVYEAGLNGEKAGEEYLAPFYNDYRFWIQYQTYDVTQLLCPGENVLSVMLGDGWYKGRFSYLDEARVTEIYGDKFLAAAQLLITYKDGSQQKITTDENWRCLPSPVLFPIFMTARSMMPTGISGTAPAKSAPARRKRPCPSAGHPRRRRS